MSINICRRTAVCETALIHSHAVQTPISTLSMHRSPFICPLLSLPSTINSQVLPPARHGTAARSSESLVTLRLTQRGGTRTGWKACQSGLTRCARNVAASAASASSAAHSSVASRVASCTALCQPSEVLPSVQLLPYNGTASCGYTARTLHECLTPVRALLVYARSCRFGYSTHAGQRLDDKQNSARSARGRSALGRTAAGWVAHA